MGSVVHLIPSHISRLLASTTIRPKESPLLATKSMLCNKPVYLKEAHENAHVESEAM